MSAPSRYATVGIAHWSAPDGRQVPYLLRRALPAVGDLGTLRMHVMAPNQRVDVVAALELGDAELSWQLADANGVMRPRDLEETGRAIRVPLPPGVPGPAHG